VFDLHLSGKTLVYCFQNVLVWRISCAKNERKPCEMEQSGNGLCAGVSQCQNFKTQSAMSVRHRQENGFFNSEAKSSKDTAVCSITVACC